MGEPSTKYLPRNPGETVLHQVIKSNLDGFYCELSRKEKRIPKYVREEFEAYLGCGLLENGFARLKCTDCGHEKLLAFSCKRRGFCPSCCGRRMHETEKHLSDEVFPVETTRQWVLSLPIPSVSNRVRQFV